MKKLNVPETCQIPILQELYDTHFGDLENGYFVEVGAFDGESWSNTSCLADIGWSGLYIEPMPYAMERCKNRHANNSVTYECVAIDTVAGQKEIAMVGGLSTVSPRCHEAHKSFFDPRIFSQETTDIVTTQRLDVVLQKHNVPKYFDLLVVDVEGYEFNVFNSFLLSDYLPKMIIAELCDVCHSYANFVDLQEQARWVRQHIINAGYTEVYCDAINTVFIK